MANIFAIYGDSTTIDAAVGLTAGTRKISNLSAPSAGTDAVNKDYADAVATGLSWKDAVEAGSTGNIGSLSGYGPIDGVTLEDGYRVLVKNQSTTSQNGIYIAAAGAWSRSTDADTGSELDGAAVFVKNGTANADKAFVQINVIPLI